MQLYIGGYAQGKLAYVQEKLNGQEVPVARTNVAALRAQGWLAEPVPAQKAG